MIIFFYERRQILTWANEVSTAIHDIVENGLTGNPEGKNHPGPMLDMEVLFFKCSGK